MRGTLLTSVAIAALATPALAADLPLKAPAAVAAPWTWSGFYAGGHGGCGWGHDSRTTVNDPFFAGKFPGFATTTSDPQGCLGGFQAGANWQAGRIVSGLEIDLSATSIKGSSSVAPTPTVSPFGNTTGSATTSGQFEWLGSARARLGYLATPDILLYGTGGLGWTEYVESRDLTVSSFNVGPPAQANAQFSFSSSPSRRFGWVAGLGAEARLFNTNWLARLEYLHYDFGNTGSGSQTLGFFLPVTEIRTTGNLTADVVRAGLSYKFDPDRFALGFAGASVPVAGAAFYKAPPPVAVPWTWAGFYLGAHAGYGWGHDPFSNQALANGVRLNGVDSQGFVGGFQAGANWQSRSVVAGLEIDLSATGIKGSASNTTVAVGVTSQATQTDKFDPLGSARARLGYLVMPGLLLYGTGGLGWTRLETSENTTTTPGTPTSDVTPSWLFGWVAGLGLEARLGNTNWLGRVEYLHYDFGSGGATLITNAGATTTVTSSGHVTNDVVRAGLSYKLDWPGMGGGASNAYASAMPVKGPVAAVWSWSGFYVGGHAGYGWGHNSISELVTRWEPATIDQLQGPQTIMTGPNSSGFVGGFQAGANWEGRSIVDGLELDLSGGDINGSASAAGRDTLGNAVSATKTSRFDLLGSARARLGYLVLPDVLLYGTGGLAWTHIEQTIASVTVPGAFIDLRPTATWRSGWVAGAGGEVRLWNTNWLARLEYLHYDFGDSANSSQGFTQDGAVNFLTNLRTSGHLTADVVRAGIDYKLD